MHFDYWALTLELPYLLHCTEDDIKIAPYITPDGAYLEKWQEKIGNKTGVLVGIRWKGEESRDASQMRALPFSELEKITHIEGVTTISLQKGHGREDIPVYTHIIDAGKDLETWEDTVALISLLDIVITSDTSVAHLASAMGKETCVVVRSFPYFAWTSAKEGTTPWYQNTRVFIEKTQGNFEVPLLRVQDLLVSKTTQNSPLVTENSNNIQESSVVVEFPNMHMTMHIHPENELISNILRTQKWYSKRDLTLFDLFLSQGDVCIDAGANIGWYSLYAASLVGSQGKVVAVEPDVQNFTILQKNSAENKLPQIEALHCALGREASGSFYLYRSDENFGDHFISEKNIAIDRDSTKVPITNIDTLVQKIGRQPRLIKIDVQGSEVEVLEGMKQTLAHEEQPILLVEFAPACMKRIGYSPFEFFVFIDSHTMTPFRVCDDYSGMPLLMSLGIQDLLEFTKENRDKEVGWDILLIPQNELHLLKSEAAIRLFS